MRSENARTASKKHNESKLLRFVQNGGLLDLKAYLKKRGDKMDINFKINKQQRTCLHIAALLGDDGIIRTLLKNGANPMCADNEGNIPAHLAAKWCSREENYGDYKLVMTPLVQAAPASLNVTNTNGETAQSYLDLGAKRTAETKAELKKEQESLAKAEEAKERELDEKDKKREADEEFNQKVRDEATAEGLETGFDSSRYAAEKEEELNETFDAWADRIAQDYETKRKIYAQNWGHAKQASYKRTATGGMATGNRNKDGRKKRKEQERLEYLDHKQRRVDNYIRDMEAKKEDERKQQKEEYTRKVEKLKTGSDTLRYRDIPWPCDGTVQDMVDVMLADAKITEPAAYRKHIFKQQLIWHPDKFAQKAQDRLHPDDKDKILETVHHISQTLNKALENAQLM